MGFRTSRCLRQPDYLARHFDYHEIHSFASLLRNRFAFIDAIVLKELRSKPMAIFQFQTFLSSFNYFLKTDLAGQIEGSEADHHKDTNPFC